MATQIQLRRDISTNWTSSNPVLAEGEVGIETDTKYYKIGDGSTAWTSLSYSGRMDSNGDVDMNGNSINKVYSPGVLVWSSGSLVHLDVDDYADIGACLNDARTQYGLEDNIFKVVPGTYDLTTSVNYTHVDGGVTHKLDLYGTTIRVKTGSGTNGFEFVGTDRSHIAITGGRIYGDSTDPADTGFLLARTTNTSYDNNAFISLRDVNIEGYWAEAPIADVASEAISYSDCDFNNEGGAGYCAIFTRSNIRSLTTQYADGIKSSSMSTHKFSRCGFRQKTNTGEGVILADGWHIWNFDTCYFHDHTGGDIPIFDMRFQTGPLSFNGYLGITWQNCMNDTYGTQGTTFSLKNESGEIGHIKESSIQGGHFGPDPTNYLINSIGTDSVDLWRCDIGFSQPFTDIQGSKGISVNTVGESNLKGKSFNSSLTLNDRIMTSLIKDLTRTDITGTIDPDNNFLDEKKVSEGYIKGLTVSTLNVTYPNHEIEIASGKCAMKTASSDEWSAQKVEISSAITIDIATSGANGLETSDSENSSTWYEVYLIADANGANNPAGLLNEAGTNIGTFPSGYDRKRHIGYVRNDGSSDFLATYMQTDGRVYFDNYITLINDASLTDNSSETLDTSAAVPPQGEYVLTANLMEGDGTASSYATLNLDHGDASMSDAFTGMSRTSIPADSGVMESYSFSPIPVNSSKQIKYCTDKMNQIYIRAVGYKLPRQEL